MRRIPLPKGITGDIPMTFVIIMILMLVLLAALLYPQYNLFTRIATKTPYDVCRQSVEQASFMRLGNIELSPFLKCQTEQITIKEKDEETAKKKIADALYNCYYQFGRGEKELFSGTGTFCFVCSTIDFEDEGKKIVSLPEFNKYLFENYANTEETYAHYLYKDETKKTMETLKQKGEYTKTMPVQKLSVLLSYDRRTTEELKEEVTDFALLGGAGAIAGIGLAATGFGAPVVLGVYALSAGSLAGGFGAYQFGQFTNIATVALKPYSTEELNKLGCTQKIQQKPT